MLTLPSSVKIFVYTQPDNGSANMKIQAVPARPYSYSIRRGCETVALIGLRTSLVNRIITASHQPAVTLLHAARQDQHSYILCLSDVVKNAPVTSA